MSRGGARKNAGGKKPELSPGKKKVMISKKIDPILVKWLKKQNNATRVIEAALREYREKYNI